MYEWYSVLWPLIICGLACLESSLEAWIKYSELTMKLKARSLWAHCCAPPPPRGLSLLPVNLRLTYTPPTNLHLCSCLTCIHPKNKPTPNFPFLSLTLPGWGSSATTGLLVEVLREQGEHCLNYSKTQLPSAPRSKAEDYQQPAVMRPQWLEIAGTAWYTLSQPQHRYERLRWNTLRKTTVI